MNVTSCFWELSQFKGSQDKNISLVPIDSDAKVTPKIELKWTPWSIGTGQNKWFTPCFFSICCKSQHGLLMWSKNFYTCLAAIHSQGAYMYSFHMCAYMYMSMAIYMCVFSVKWSIIWKRASYRTGLVFQVCLFIALDFG